MTAETPLRLGIAGLGTVGCGLVSLLTEHHKNIAERCGRPVAISAVSARARHKDRGVDLSAVRWFDDPVLLAADPGIDVFVELIGGESGVALESVEAALKAGKHVVTANKALLARHGPELAARAEKAGVALNFEAAVAGGIPIVKTLRESLLGNSEWDEQLHSHPYATRGLAFRGDFGRCAGARLCRGRSYFRCGWAGRRA